MTVCTVCTVVKSKVKISQNFVAFSEYMNFNIQFEKFWEVITFKVFIKFVGTILYKSEKERSWVLFWLGPNHFGQVQITLSLTNFYNLDLSKIIWSQPKWIGLIQNNWYSTNMIRTNRRSKNCNFLKKFLLEYKN